jgi:hypothetical protein
MGSQARCSEARTSTWHWAQATRPCVEAAYCCSSTKSEIFCPFLVMVRSVLPWHSMQSLVDMPCAETLRRTLCGEWQSVQDGTLCGSFSQSRPSTTFLWTCSMRWWQRVQVAAMLARLMEARGSSTGSTRWPVWQELHTAVTVRPFL